VGGGDERYYGLLWSSFLSQRLPFFLRYVKHLNLKREEKTITLPVYAGMCVCVATLNFYFRAAIESFINLCSFTGLVHHKHG
jgi:hypothetical protein